MTHPQAMATFSPSNTHFVASQTGSDECWIMPLTDDAADLLALTMGPEGENIAANEAHTVSIDWLVQTLWPRISGAGMALHDHRTGQRAMVEG